MLINISYFYCCYYKYLTKSNSVAPANEMYRSTEFLHKSIGICGLLNVLKAHKSKLYKPLKDEDGVSHIFVSVSVRVPGDQSQTSGK